MPRVRRQRNTVARRRAPEEHKRPSADVAGKVMWLPHRHEIADDVQMEEGCYNHPVVIISADQDEHGRVDILIITSFGSTTLATKHGGNIRARLEHLPIDPAPRHPDNSKLLTLRNPSRPLRKDSYVKIRSQHTIKFSILKGYDHEHSFYLSDLSFQELLACIGRSVPLARSPPVTSQTLGDERHNKATPHPSSLEVSRNEDIETPHLRAMISYGAFAAPVRDGIQRNGRAGDAIASRSPSHSHARTSTYARDNVSLSAHYVDYSGYPACQSPSTYNLPAYRRYYSPPEPSGPKSPGINWGRIAKIIVWSLLFTGGLCLLGYFGTVSAWNWAIGVANNVGNALGAAGRWLIGVKNTISKAFSKIMEWIENLVRAGSRERDDTGEVLTAAVDVFHLEARRVLSRYRMTE